MESKFKVIKNSKISIRTKPMIKAALREQAEKEGLPLSRFIENLMIQELQRRDIQLVATLIIKII